MRCMLTVAACMGLTLGTARYAAASCGDGVTTTGEACDAGTATCAAGSKEAGSECHKQADCTGGPAGVDKCLCNTTQFPGGCNFDDAPNACRSNCMLPMCGDGVSDSSNGEQCDNGANNGSGKPCYGSAPNSVCSNATGTTLGTNLFIPGALVPCTNDGACAFASQAFCRGNPQCHLNTCGDGVACTDPACTTGRYFVNPGIPGPEQCDDGNTSNMDGCVSFNYSVTIGTAVIPDACASNICGDGVSNMGVEQCDLGLAVCLDGPKATKPCASNADCMVGNVMGTLNCSATVGALLGLPSGADNGNIPNSERRVRRRHDGEQPGAVLQQGAALRRWRERLHGCERQRAVRFERDGECGPSGGAVVRG